MNIWYLLEKFWDKKNVFTFFLISKDKENLLEFIKNNIDDNNFTEFVLNSLLKEDKTFLYEIIKDLDLEDSQEKLLVKISLENEINLLSWKNKNIINEIIRKWINLENILLWIEDLNLLDYLLNKSTTISNNFGKIYYIYDTISQDKKDIINNFFFKKVKIQIWKFNLNQILKWIRNKVNTKYSWNDTHLKTLSKSLNLFNEKLLISESIFNKNNSFFSFYFDKINNNFFNFEIFILTDIVNKKIYINLISTNENLTSKISANSIIWNKHKNSFLHKIEKLLWNKISKIDDWYDIICNTFIFTKLKENIENNIFNYKSDCAVLMMIKLSDQWEKDFKEKIFWFFESELKKKYREDNDWIDDEDLYK